MKGDLAGYIEGIMPLNTDAITKQLCLEKSAKLFDYLSRFV
jgi:hypothetical protein